MVLRRGYWLFTVALLTLWRSVPAAEVEVINRASLAQRVQHLERVIEGQGLSRLLLQVERLQASMRQLQGKIEEIRHKLKGLENQQRELYQDLDRRLQRLIQTKETLVAPSPGKTAGGVTTEHVAADPGEKAYRAALELLNKGHYEEAVTALSQFPQQYPNSRYRANAQYWLAEAQYVLGNFEAAARAFQTLIEQYPKSAKVPDALLKQGLAYYELQQWEQAKALFQEAITRFPDSTVSRLAQERIDKMQRENHI